MATQGILTKLHSIHFYKTKGPINGRTILIELTYMAGYIWQSNTY